MPVDMQRKLLNYIAAFNRLDDEIYTQLIPNRDAAAFLSDQIPLIDCPDSDIEKTYYFRWWTYRKHIKQTEKGHIITEFLPDVRWAGPYNSIVCPACFHIREGRWLKDPEQWLKEYISFWLDGHGNALAYSSWLAWAVWEYCSHKNDFAYGIEKLPQLVAFFEKREAIHRRSCGLYWSSDDRDGMEYSISGPGLRLTMNSYACADADAIARLAEMAGDTQLQARFASKAAEIRQQMDHLLWNEGFYRALPLRQDADPALPSRPPVAPEHHVRELQGFVPWYFDIPGDDKLTAFDELFKPNGFQTPYGLTTAEQRHPRFLEEHTHECLWNGYVWPFATSQALVAAANVLHGHKQSSLTKNVYYEMLLQYARSHKLTLEDGTVIPWIDESMHPRTGRWITRDLLKAMGWLERKGGCERGKDYNHSLFCDLVLSGLFGISVQNGTVTADPLIPDSWEYFRVENLWVNGKQYRILYDKTGTHYGEGVGLTVSCTNL